MSSNNISICEFFLDFLSHISPSYPSFSVTGPGAPAAGLRAIGGNGGSVKVDIHSAHYTPTVLPLAPYLQSPLL